MIARQSEAFRVPLSICANPFPKARRPLFFEVVSPRGEINYRHLVKVEQQPTNQTRVRRELSVKGNKHLSLVGWCSIVNQWRHTVKFLSSHQDTAILKSSGKRTAVSVNSV